MMREEQVVADFAFDALASASPAQQEKVFRALARTTGRTSLAGLFIQAADEARAFLERRDQLVFAFQHPGDGDGKGGCV